jgi:pimeloyl-ACP methyl ester carboxylesterase
LWPDSRPEDIDSWGDLARDLRGAVESYGFRGSIAVGHSLGGVLSILAEAARPGLFSRLVLIDPVVFTGRRTLLWGVSKVLGLGRWLPLVRGARRRRDRFPDRRTVRDVYSGKPVFSTWEPQVLDDYVRAGFCEADGTVVLRYPRAWEARIFELAPASVWRHLRRIDVPMLVLRGGRSDTFVAEAARRAERFLPNATIVEIPELTHFLPMEQPAAVADLIASWCGRMSRLE